MSALLVCLPLAACTSSDAHECPSQIDAPTDAMFPLDAPPPDAPPPDAFAFPIETQTLIAMRQLTLFEARLPDMLVGGEFPVVIQGFTPAASCCGPSGVNECPDSPSAWDTPAWNAFDFDIQGPHHLVYSIQSWPDSLTVTARMDLDCDGEFTAIYLSCLREPTVRCVIQYPGFLE